MDRFIIFLAISLPLCFALLYFVVIPILRKISKRLQGDAFTFRMYPSGEDKSSQSSARYDILWSALAILLSLLITMSAIGLVDYLGIIKFRESQPVAGQTR